MSVLEARQNADGTLAFSFADELVDSFWDDVPVTMPTSCPHDWTYRTGTPPSCPKKTCPASSTPRRCCDIDPDTTECGLLLRSSAGRGPVLRSAPGTETRHGSSSTDGRATITGDAQWHVSGDVPFEIELERPCDLAPGEHTLEVIVDGDLCVAVLDRQVALSTRIYDLPSGRVGVFAGEGIRHSH